MELKQHLIPKLKALRLSGILDTLEVRTQQALSEQWTYGDFLERLLEDEVERRGHAPAHPGLRPGTWAKQLAMRLRRATLNTSKTLETFDFTFNPGLNRQLVYDLATGAYIRDKRNVLLCGPTGVGKTFLACALGQAVCRQGFNVRYERTSRLLHQLHLAQADGSYAKLLASLARLPLLILDDWLRDPLTTAQARDVLEILDDRYGRTSTLIATQIPVTAWHARIPDPTLADAILDRLVHQAHRLELKGESMRKTRTPLS